MINHGTLPKKTIDFPPRPKKLTRTILCECGHSYFDHEESLGGIGFMFFYGHHGKCEKCMCPKYDRQRYLD